MTKTKEKISKLECRIKALEEELLLFKDQINMLGVRSQEAVSFNDIVDEWTNGAKNRK